MYELTKLENGFTIATATMPHMAGVSAGLWVGVGGRYENAPLNGVCHFIEHMLFKGTKRRNAKQISQAVEGVGGYLNAFTSEEQTCFYARAPHDKLGNLLDVLFDMVLHSRFDTVEIDKERSVIKEEVAMYLDQPSSHVMELLNETLWPEHPLGRPLTGTLETLDGLRREELVAYLQSHYVAPGSLLTVAGRIKHKEVVELAKKLSKTFAKGRRATFQPVSPIQKEPRIKLFTKDIEQTHLALGLRSCSRHDERRFALRLLNVILGENMSSRLFQVVREEHGLAYSIQSGQNSFDDTGALIVTAGVDTEKTKPAIKLIAQELKRIREKLVSATELREARDYLLGQMDLSLESTENQMMWLGEQLLSYGRITKPEETKRRLAEVKPSDIRAVAREFFQPERMSLAMVSPMKSDRGLKELLVA
ncbi:MAG TPA: pitrilysin family protein [Verrucomicrobiae bacterium]